MRIPRDFFSRPGAEQEWLCSNSWCNRCKAADLGIDEPTEFAEDGRVLLEGKCRACGSACITELIETIASNPPTID
jgi:hypothetical protein